MKVMLDKEGREGARLPGGLLDPDGTSLAVSATPGVCPVASKGVGAVPSAPQAQPPTVRK